MVFISCFACRIVWHRTGIETDTGYKGEFYAKENISYHFNNSAADIQFGFLFIFTFTNHSGK